MSSDPRPALPADTVEAAIARIERDGYCVLHGLYDSEQTERALALVERWQRETGGKVTRDVPAMATDPIVWNLQNKDHYFLELLFARDQLERILVHFLNDRWYRAIPPDSPNYILRAYVARSGLAALPLHIDSFVPYEGERVITMQCSIMLQDMSEANGCSLVVPGSHRSGEYVEQSAVEGAVPVEAAAGDVVVWDSRIWHGARPNDSGRPRWTLIATFARWWIKQAFRIPDALPAEIYERLTPSQKAVLGFCSVPHADELEGIMTQRGHDDLPETPPSGRRGKAVK